ncbi:gliding motility-associated protein GldE [Paraflavitalea sp. CAU 1676]|uniref:gliding motility-associated protein GldE n=1 Tax=Paraflavitalea sp. CAU 1676 TaxID=3032598 RepID=UPI0023DB25D2|nr:gliding motility-associated protein GldE [Paraflavitalea sp. CAU 1676]MDF2193599.1 gliding motility-associated protein GldE [Paraflavitalea sp. CAU 1676]
MDNPFRCLLSGEVWQPVFLAVNVQTTTILSAVVLILLLLSFFIAGAKVAFFSLTYRDVNMLKTKQDSGWKRIANLLEEPGKLQAALMIANTLINIAIIILANFLIDNIFTFKQDGVFVQFLVYFLKAIVISAVIVLFGEILPKVRANQNNLRSAYESSFLVEVIYYLFKRLAGGLVNLSDRVERIFGGKASRALTQKHLEEEIRSTIREEGEQRILAGIYKFANITVKQVMCTRLDVHGVEYGISFKELKKIVQDEHYSRLPVYKRSLDDIQGIIHSKDLVPHLNEPDNFDWQSLLRPPFFVHEQKFIEDLLTEFQTKRIHFAVVVDEFGGTSGIITLEDILEEIIGEIKDEFDDEESGNKKIDDATYIFEGRTMIYDACSTMNLPADTFDQVKGESDSLAGLILELAGEIPKAGDVVPIGDFEFTILEVERNRIKKVKVDIKPGTV